MARLLLLVTALALHGAVALKQQTQSVRLHDAPVPAASEPMAMDLKTFLRTEAERVPEDWDEEVEGPAPTSTQSDGVEDEDLEQDPFHHKGGHTSNSQRKPQKVAPQHGLNRCGEAEVAKIHRGLADDLSGTFAQGGAFGLHWPDFSMNGTLPDCAKDDLVTDTEFKGTQFVWCLAKRLSLSLRCVSCFSDLVQHVFPPPKTNDTSKSIGVGCNTACMPALVGCKMSLLDMTEVDKCVGENMHTCTKCLGNPAVRLTECVGDPSPFTPATLIQMMQNGYQEKGSMLAPLGEFIQGIGMQALVDEHRLAHPTSA